MGSPSDTIEALREVALANLNANPNEEPCKCSHCALARAFLELTESVEMKKHSDDLVNATCKSCEGFAAIGIPNFCPNCGRKIKWT